MKKLYAASAFLLTVFSVIFPHICQHYAKNAVEMCINVLLPSLFPFIVCTNFLISSGAADTLSKILKRTVSRLFNISGNGSVILIMGLISGYPIGAMLTGSMYKEGRISKNEAIRLLMFANNCGPLFIISAVGIGVFSSIKTGVLLYASHLLAALTVGFFAGYFGDKNKFSTDNPAVGRKPFAAVIPDSVTSVLSLCGYVIFFSSVMGILCHTGVCDTISRFLSLMGMPYKDSALFSKGIFEMSSAVFSCEGASLPAVCAILSFGGISVLFQTLSFCRKYSLPITSYILGKILCAGISALYTALLSKIFMPHTAVFSIASESMKAKIPLFSFLSVICLFLLFLYFIFLPLLQDGKSACPGKRNLFHTRS